MAKYTNEQIINILKNPKSEGEKSSALVSQRHHRLHVLGEGYKEWWLGNEAKGFESKETHARKKQICNPTTPRIFEQLQKQFTKIFRAKGDVFEYHFIDSSKDKVKDFKERLKTVSHGLSIDELMMVIWNKAMWEEFNGFFGIELEKEENLKTPNVPEVDICFYPLKDIYDVDIRGKEIKYIVICTNVVKEGKPTEAYRFIDSEQDIIYIKVDGNFQVNTLIGAGGVDVPDSYVNPFGAVPFAQISNYRANVYSDFKKNSPISKVIPDADTYLSVSDDHQVSVKRHQHPLFFCYPVTCPTCSGQKTMRVADPVNDNQFQDVDCNYCKASGQVSYLKGDILQGISLPISEKQEQDGIPAAQSPAGYVVNDHESIREQRIELADAERFIEKGVLGVEGILTTNKSVQQTATETELDLQPLIDTLNSYSANAESVRQRLTDLIGKYLYPTEYIDSYIHYGRKYFLKSEERVIQEYSDAKAGGANESFLKELLEELYYVRFENNPSALRRSLMLLDIEPMPTRNSMEELILVKEFCDVLTLKIKVNFNDLVERFEREIMPITMFKPELEYNKRISEILKQLSVYATEINPPKPEPATTGQSNSPSTGVGSKKSKSTKNVS